MKKLLSDVKLDAPSQSTLIISLSSTEPRHAIQYGGIPYEPVLRSLDQNPHMRSRSQSQLCACRSFLFIQAVAKALHVWRDYETCMAINFHSSFPHMSLDYGSSSNKQPGLLFLIYHLRLAHTMCLSMLAAKTVLLIRIVVVGLAPARPRAVALHVVDIV